MLHLAAQADVRLSVADPAADAAVNVTGTINVLKAALDVGARVVFASTGGAIYGADAARPTPESAACEPEAPYGTAKLCAEEYVRLFNRLHGTQHAILRLGNVYGPRQDPSGEAGVVSIFAGRVVRNERPTVFGDGRQTRDYVYVGDVVQAFVAAADAGIAGLWNVGTGREVSVIDLIDELAGISGATIERRVRARPAGRAAGLEPRSGAGRARARRVRDDVDAGRPAGRLRVGACGRAGSRHPVGVRAAVIPLLAVALAIALLAGHGGLDARSAAIVEAGVAAAFAIARRRRLAHRPGDASRTPPC